MTIRADIVALLDPLFDARVSADDEPRGGMEFPYALVLDHITEGVMVRGDGRGTAWRRTIQVDVFQRLSDEDPDLLDTVTDTLDGAPITGAMHLSVNGSSRMPDPVPDTVHHLVTCTLARLVPARPPKTVEQEQP